MTLLSRPGSGAAGVWHAGAVSEPDPALALVAEACRRSPLVWVRAGHGRAQPVWSVWQDDALLIIVGGEEQPDPVPEDVEEVDVAVRSKTAQSRLVTFRARVEVLSLADERWTTAAEALKAERLNARHADTLVDRWAASSRILRLVPTGTVLEEPGHYDDSTGAMPPAPSTAVTVVRHPFHLGRRPRRR